MKTFYRTTSQVLMGNVTAETVYRHLSLILIHGKCFDKIITETFLSPAAVRLSRINYNSTTYQSVEEHQVRAYKRRQPHFSWLILSLSLVLRQGYAASVLKACPAITLND